MRVGHIPNDPLRVLHLTDPHLFADRNGELRGVVTYASLRRVVAHYLASDWEADLVALTGDVIQDDSTEAYGHCRELLAELDRPVFGVPGNHDVRSLMGGMLDEPPFEYCGSRDFGAWQLVSVDSCAAGRAGGAIREEEIGRAEDIIARSNADHMLVCLHHPPVPVHSAWLDSVGLDNGPAFLSRMAATGRVRAMIFGHVHQAYDKDHDGIRVIATPSTCRQFLPFSDEFAVDDKPQAYRRISLGAGGDIETEVIWVSDE